MRKILVTLALLLGMAIPTAALATTTPTAVQPAYASMTCSGSRYHTWPVGWSTFCTVSGASQYRVTGTCRSGWVLSSAWTNSGTRRAGMTCPLETTGRPTGIQIQTR